MANISHQHGPVRDAIEVDRHRCYRELNLFQKFDTTENGWSIFSNQNVAVKRKNMAQFALILVSIDNSHSQLSIDTKIIKNLPIPLPFMVAF